LTFDVACSAFAMNHANHWATWSTCHFHDKLEDVAQPDQAAIDFAHTKYAADVLFAVNIELAQFFEFRTP
jgi:hypothetical protein